MAGGRDVEDIKTARLEIGAYKARDLQRIRYVGLVERDESRTVAQIAAGRLGVGGQLGLDDVEIGQRVTTRIDRGAVDDVNQCGATLDVTQEVVAESAALARTLDQPRYVCDRERRRAGRDDAQVGNQ